LHTRGTIFHHSQLVFHNGFVGKKYLILLNTPSKNEPYLLVKATSQQKNKPVTPGCIKNLSLFFIPERKTFFTKNTWIQLYELYPMPPESIHTNKEMSVVGELGAKIIDDIVNCLFDAEEDNLATIHKKLLRPPIQDSLLKLKDLFSKDRC
jgi:hypothetical protein